ncbi:hypothetical protein EBH_0000750 [Eimeria brunetti]|uniref:Uncharacterized protein n=1 Tax=Eimeria brunetti TaxID=51314 RepID=U6LQF2_9EIME|nr:hypothetical protein EBH_0000750 [Eimeria brunetti]
MTPLEPQLQTPVPVLSFPSQTTATGRRWLLQRSPRSSRNLFAGAAAVAAVVSLVMLVAVFAVCQARRQRQLVQAAERRRLSYTGDDSDELSFILEQCLDLQEEHGLHLPLSERVDEKEAKQRLVAMLHASAAAFEQTRALASPQSVQYEGRFAHSGVPENVQITPRELPRAAVWGGPSGATVAPAAGPRPEGVTSFSPEEVPYGGIAFSSQQRREHSSSQRVQYEGRFTRNGAPQRMHMSTPQRPRTAVWGGPSGAAVGPVAGPTAGKDSSFAAEEAMIGDAIAASHSHSSAPYDIGKAFSAAILATIDGGGDAAAAHGDDASATQLVGLASVSPDNALAAALSPDAWLEDVPKLEVIQGVKQSTKATESPLVASNDKRDASVGRRRARPPRQIGKQERQAVSGAASGVPGSATSGETKQSSEGNREGCIGNQDLALHPFVRLPKVNPQDVRSCFRLEYAKTERVSMLSPMESFIQMRRLFAKPSLTADEVETLMFEAECLVSYAKTRLAKPFRRRTSSYLFQKLATLFMFFDYLVCTIETVGDKMLANIWWDEFASSFNTDFNLPKLAKTRRTRLLNKLVNRLSEALSVYKRGRRPPFEVVIELKRLILTQSAYKGSQIMHPLWSLWLQDDKEFLLSRGCSKEGPSDSQEHGQSTTRETS